MTITIILSIIIIILLGFCFHKYRINQDELHKYQQLIEKQKYELDRLESESSEAERRKEEAEKQYYKLTQQISETQTHLEEQYQRAKEAHDKILKLEFDNKKNEYENQLKKIEEETKQNIDSAREEELIVQEDLKKKKNLFNSLLEPLKHYEQEQQERLFYTIQIPEEYREDIDFLLTTVSQKVRHPDIINKLVWSEYVKPYIDETFKRIMIEEKPGIYKLTNLNNGRCYIGKSTNVKKRIIDHFKSSVGISTIADQAVHHAILKDGLWNWLIEIITYADKEQLNELEKYYIDFFKAQEFGYNKNAGGGG